ncbi:hypothetical protein RISK_004937 [Rhodopirellula islandica]|uniref:Uncharacterized protein n=1 Tax=Rhodopirellula islandica TaxID=595434 RepID=A0A0J1B8B9_RHOIS|nr:hypothetical protein [Rhodopirellula islandica]KLU02967.1 hypothetical protein RISK_004937 [Rhodopirellula islandica]
MSEAIDQEDKAEAERSRLSQRHALKRRIAEADVASARAKELRGIIATLDADDERATEEHQAATAPIQAELTSLDEKHIEQLLAGKQLSGADADRRGVLLRQLQEVNGSLEDVIASNKRSRKKVRMQVFESEEQSTSRPADRENLVRLASSKLQLQSFAAKQDLQWAHARLKSAKASVEKNQGFLSTAERTNDYGNKQVYRDRIARWEFEMSEAKNAVAQCEQLVDELRAKMIAE